MSLAFFVSEKKKTESVVTLSCAPNYLDDVLDPLLLFECFLEFFTYILFRKIFMDSFESWEIWFTLV